MILILSKSLTTLGALLSAISGIYLTGDDIERKISREFVRNTLIAVPILLTVIISVVLSITLGIHSAFTWTALIVDVLLISIALCQANINPPEGNHLDHKIAWVFFVSGLVMLLFGSICDSFLSWGG